MSISATKIPRHKEIKILLNQALCKYQKNISEWG